MAQQHSYQESCTASVKGRLGAEISAPKPRDIPASALEIDRLFNCVSELQNMVGRIEDAANRLVGSAPEEACTQPECPPPPFTIGKLVYGLNDFQRNLTRLREQIARLESFV